MTANAHAAAMLALLGADDATPALVVLDGRVPSGVLPPYVLVYFAGADPQQAESESLTNRSDRHVTRAYAHSVGVTAEAARMVDDRVRAAWLDVTPAIGGRECWPIRREEGPPADPDETTGASTFDQVSVYRLESVPG